MEFTDAYKQTGSCCFSPDSRFLAIAVNYRLVIRDVVSFKVIQLYTCVDKISYIEWAMDSEYILCGLYKRPMVQAWSLTQPEWTCKIDEGPAGIAYARWSPDSRHILTTSEFQLRLTVWSLVNTACVHVQWPKHTSKGVSFTRDGKFSAICTRWDCRDYINLLSCHSWEFMGTFAVDTVDLAGVEWSPDDSALVIWDSLLEYKVLIYSPDGRCLHKYQAYESGLGVKTVAWSPCGQFLAVGSYDQILRALNHLTWKMFAELMHIATLRNPCNAAIFKVYCHGAVIASISSLATIPCQLFFGYGIFAASSLLQFWCRKSPSVQQPGIQHAHALCCAQGAPICICGAHLELVVSIFHCQSFPSVS